MKPKKLFLNNSSNDTSVRTVCRRPSAVDRLAAFTMLELITVLALSTIVIGTAYTAYEIIYKDFLDYKSTNTEALRTMDFVTTFERDVAKCDSVIIQDYGIQLFQKQHIIQYEFNEINTVRYLSKNIAITDTFSLEVRTFEVENKILFLEYIPICLECTELQKGYSLSLEINSIRKE